jgi:hypothetical protein
MAYGIFFGTVLHVKSDKLCSKVCFPPISVTRHACLNVWFRALAGLRWMTVMGAEQTSMLHAHCAAFPANAEVRNRRQRPYLTTTIYLISKGRKSSS